MPNIIIYSTTQALTSHRLSLPTKSLLQMHCIYSNESRFRGSKILNTRIRIRFRIRIRVIIWDLLIKFTNYFVITKYVFYYKTIIITANCILKLITVSLLY